MLRSLRTLSLGLLLVALSLASAGCQKLNVKQSVDLADLADIKMLTIEPTSREQKLAVTITPSGGPVNVYVVKDTEMPAFNKALENQQKLGVTLASKEKVGAKETLEVTLPAKTGATVFLTGANKKTTVEVQIVGH